MNQQIHRIDADTLNRALIGFDSMFNNFERKFANNVSNNYPPHNVVKIDENHYEIQVAVTGFNKDEVAVELDQNVLIITAGRESEEEKHYIHRGLAQRNFVKHFPLAEHIEVRGAEQKNGVLTIKLERLVPEYLKPRRIDINYGE
jgi:molecular chaperone IbpA